MVSRRWSLGLLLTAILVSAASAAPSGPLLPGLRAVTLSGPAGAETTVTGLTLADGSRIAFDTPQPLFSLLVDGKLVAAADLPGGVAFSVAAEDGFKPGAKLRLVFRNGTKAKVSIENLVPLGQGTDRAYITAGLPNAEPHTLDRSQLFRPGRQPVGVLLPDNAWHLGFATVDTGGRGTSSDRRSPAGSRPTRPSGPAGPRSSSPAARSNTPSISRPMTAAGGGASRSCSASASSTTSRRFDNALFERADLAWVRRAYLMVLQFAWDRAYYDRDAGGYVFDRTLTAWDKLLGPDRHLPRSGRPGPGWGSTPATSGTCTGTCPAAWTSCAARSISPTSWARNTSSPTIPGTRAPATRTTSPASRPCSGGSTPTASSSIPGASRAASSRPRPTGSSPASSCTARAWPCPGTCPASSRAGSTTRCICRRRST